MDIESDKSDGGSSDEELMDDDQMMAVDERLTAVFKARANEKRPAKG
jgi:DNA polymerase phi